MYYREAGTKKWNRCTYAHYISSGLSDMVRSGEVEVKHIPVDTPKQKRQKQIASALRSLSCAVAQLKTVSNLLNNMYIDDLPGWLQSELRLSKAGVNGLGMACLPTYQDLRDLNKYIAKANKESKTS